MINSPSTSLSGLLQAGSDEGWTGSRNEVEDLAPVMRANDHGRPTPPRRGRRFGLLGRLLLSVLGCNLIVAPCARAQSLGELLYTTHCIACHTTEVHWRDNRSASNWTSLNFQVRRWQDVVSLRWSDGEVLAVSRYLNDSIYHFEQTTGQVSSTGLDSIRAAAGPTHRLRMPMGR